MNEADKVLYKFLLYLQSQKKERVKVSKQMAYSSIQGSVLPDGFDNLLTKYGHSRFITQNPRDDEYSIATPGEQKLEALKRQIIAEEKRGDDEKTNINKEISVINGVIKRKKDYELKIIQHIILAVVYHRYDIIQKNAANEFGEIYNIETAMTSFHISKLINEDESITSECLWTLFDRGFLTYSKPQEGFIITVANDDSGLQAFHSKLLLREYREQKTQSAINKATKKANRSLIKTNRIQEAAIYITIGIATLTLIALCLQVYLQSEDLKSKEKNKSGIIHFLQSK